MTRGEGKTCRGWLKGESRQETGGFVIEQAIRKRERKKVSIKSELERIDGRDGVEVDKGG